MSLFDFDPAAVTPVAAPATQAGFNAAFIAASKAMTLADAGLTLPPAAGQARPDYEYQQVAIAAALRSFATNGCALIGDDMGLGKTQVALSLIARQLNDTGGYAVLVGPPVVAATYRREVAATFPGLRLAHLKGRTASQVPAADIYFVSDDSQSMQAWLAPSKDARGRHVASPLAAGASIMVIDELHRHKGNTGGFPKPTLRAKVSLAASKAVRMHGKPIVGMTGTLLLNRPCEAFIPLQILGGVDLVKSIAGRGTQLASFLYEYCNPERNAYGTTFSGATNTHQLHDRLRGTCYIRRDKSDLGDLLPNINWLVTPIACNGAMSRYNAIVNDILGLIKAEQGIEAMWRAERAQALRMMGMLREEAGKARAPYTADYIADLVDQGEQVVCFYEHDTVYALLADKLTKAGITYATISGKAHNDRGKVEDDFQAGRTSVILAQTAAGGVGITLTAAPHAVFAQLPWSAGLLAQAAGRIHRTDDISRNRALAGKEVTYHVLLTADEDGSETMDNVMWSVLSHKAKVCDAVNAGKDITLPDEAITLTALKEWFAAQ